MRYKYKRQVNDIQLVADFLYINVSTPRSRRRHEDTVRRAGNIFLRTVDADIRLNLVVVRRDVFVAERPVVAHAVYRANFEIHVSEAQSDSSPVVGAPANDARAEPAKFRTRSRGVGLTVNFPEAIGR